MGRKSKRISKKGRVSDMRDAVLKQRSDCNRTYIQNGYPEEFQNIWNSRKVSDYKSRKDAGYAVFLLMSKKLKSQQELINDLTSVISSVVELDYMGKDNQGKMALVCREVLKRKEELAKMEAR